MSELSKKSMAHHNWNPDVVEDNACCGTPAGQEEISRHALKSNHCFIGTGSKRKETWWKAVQNPRTHDANDYYLPHKEQKGRHIIQCCHSEITNQSLVIRF